MVYKFGIATFHFFLASFMTAQLYAAVIHFFGESELIGMAIFVLVSVSVFYLSYKKADSAHYSYSRVLWITAGYWLLSTLFVLAQVPFLNIFLIGGLYYYLIQKNPEPLLQTQLPESH